MSKSVVTYWNPFSEMNRGKWMPIKGLEGVAEELTLSIDETTGEYTRLTRFLPGADTTPFGGKSHAYPEEVFIVSGRLYDEAFEMWLEAGHYASRPPGEIHGPFRTDIGCVVLEVSFPNKQDKTVWRKVLDRIAGYRQFQAHKRRLRPFDGRLDTEGVRLTDRSLHQVFGYAGSFRRG